MASPADLSTDTRGAGLQPSQPYVSLHPHYGMLLGVADFQADQAYHRGKMRLHNAWLHGEGVVWGLGVAADLPRGEIAVAPGLAYDGYGRELHLDQPMCLHVGRWFAAHRDDAGFSYTESGGSVQFDAHVRIRHRACLTQPVPALADSCGEGGGMAYSRVFETVEVELVPGPAPATVHRHHLLRVLLGLDPARTDDDGNVLLADQTALDARAAIAAAAPADRVTTAAAAFHHISVLDTLADTPASDPDDTERGLFPAGASPALVLADVSGIELTAQEDGHLLAAATAANEARAVLLPSATLQAASGAFLAAIA